MHTSRGLDATKNARDDSIAREPPNPSLTSMDHVDDTDSKVSPAALAADQSSVTSNVQADETFFEASHSMGVMTAAALDSFAASRDVPLRHDVNTDDNRTNAELSPEQEGGAFDGRHDGGSTEAARNMSMELKASAPSGAQGTIMRSDNVDEEVALMSSTIAVPPSRVQTHAATEDAQTSSATDDSNKKRRSVSQSFLSRPFSMFRSRKASAPLGSNSRPTSLVLTIPDKDLPQSEADSITQGPPLKASPRPTPPPYPPPQRVESWNEPDLELPTSNGEDSENAPVTPTMPGRLGVLPSPAVDSFSMRNHSPSRQFAREIDTLPETEDNHHDEGEITNEAEQVDSSPQNSAPFVTPPATRDGPGPSVPSSPSSTTTPLPAKRPGHQRNKSAIAELPSQRRAASQTHISPIFILPQSDDVEYEDRSSHQAKSYFAQEPDEDKVLITSTMMRPSMQNALARNNQGSDVQGVDGDLGVMSDDSPVVSHLTADLEADHAPLDDDTSPLTQAEQREVPAPQTTSTGEAAALQTASRPPQALKRFEDWEVVSAISAEDIGDGASGDVPGKVASDIQSRHSSVSSLGNAASHDEPETDNGIPVAMVSATPAEDVPDTTNTATSLSEHANVQETPTLFARPSTADRKIMGLPYKWLSSKKSARSSSIARSPRVTKDDTVQEIKRSVSGFANASTDTDYSGAPGIEQRPGTSNATISTELANAQQSTPSAVPNSSSVVPRERKLDGQTRDRRSRRFSGFFKQADRAEAPSEVMPDIPSAPPPHQIDSNFDGLHGLETSGPDAVLTSEPAEQPQPEQDRQSKRRSVIWDSLRRPSVSRMYNGEANTAVIDQANVPAPDPAVLEAPKPRAENTSSHRTLKKPQRAASSPIVASDSTNTSLSDNKKAKRFSGLGSLFGRSSTSAGRKPAKANKLTKMPDPGRMDAVSRQGNAPDQSFGGYDAYEAMRRQQAPVSQTRRVSEPGEMPREVAGPGRAVTSENAVPSLPADWQTPRGERYGPVGPAHLLQRSVSPPPQAPPFRRLYSGGGPGRREPLYNDVPEAFRPVDASYGRRVASIGPPPGHQPPFVYPPHKTGTPGQPSQVLPTLPTQQPYWMQPRQVPNIAPPRMRQSSASTSPSPTGASQFQDFDWRPQGSPPRPSPMHSRRGSGFALPVQTQIDRVGFVHDEIARSPARDYPDQQTPWSITLPSEQDRHEYPRYASPPTSRPMSPQSPESYVPSGMPAGGHSRRQFSQGSVVMTEVPNVHEPDPDTSIHSNRSSFTYQRRPTTSPPPADHYSIGPPPPEQRERYYSRQQSSSASFHRHTGPRAYQRTSSGYSGRRDDAAFGEEELLMRGTSYPGQEWSPTGPAPQHSWG
nr:hypothetical protein CFP56_69884 [Quercus suber]